MRLNLRSFWECSSLRTFCLLGAIVVVMGSQSRAATTYATWITIWYGRDQAWWSDKNPDATKNMIKGQWKTLDWCDNAQVDAYLDEIKKAGVTVVIADLTNGWGWLDKRCQFIQSLCAKKGMKFTLAENSGGNTESFESHAKDIWKNFAGPDAPNHETYFHYRGKPLIVCYAIRDWYKSYLKMDTPYRSRFSLVWTSGEDSSIDKWGWQLEPWRGAIPSEDSMFVTPSVRWNPGDGAMWRKSIAWLDYNFALAKKSDPKYIIVGSYDDPTERNGWLVTDAAHCEPGRQIRDKSGALNPSALYDRVCQWTKGKPKVEPGGLLRDGAYRVTSRSGRRLMIEDVEKPSQGAPGARLVVGKPGREPLGLFWLYHLGGNHYRVITLATGLALEPADDRIIQTWDTPEAKQRWTLSSAGDGYVTLKNDATGKALTLDGETVTSGSPAGAVDQQWRFQPVLIL